MEDQYQTILTSIGTALQLARQTANKGIEETAFELGIPPALVVEMERGRYSPSLQSFMQWCQVVGQSPAQILFISAEETGINVNAAIMESWQWCVHRFAEARKSLIEMENSLARKEESLRRRFERIYKPGTPQKGQNGQEKRPEDN